MIQPISDPNAPGRLALGEFSCYSILLGYPILGIWYWCTDQTIVQKILSAKTEKDGRDGAVFAGFLKILAVFLMVFPGVMAYVLFKEKIDTDNDATLMVMMTELLPNGVRGLMAAGLLAALMSTIAAALNSVATLMAEDIFKRLRPKTSDRQLVAVGRSSAGVVIILAMLWSSQGAKLDSIFEAINKIPMAFAPGITTIFLWGYSGSAATSKAQLRPWHLMSLWESSISRSIYRLSGNSQVITKELGIAFMQVGWYLFIRSSLVCLVVSLLTPAPAPAKIVGLTWTPPAGFCPRKASGWH